MVRQNRVRLAVLCLAIATLSAAAGQMYRWVDKDGKVHYSDQPPPADAKQTAQMATPVASEPQEGSSNETAAERAERMRKAADAISADRSARQGNKAENAANRAKQEQACASAKAELEKFNNANLKFMRDENNQRREMSDSEYQQVEAALKAEVEKSCR
ncbi:DUF4124 domain-containing protein [Permianibacter sp. IMCC34836]|uniref:DUF4124 domain-containing protein n=1 Tax=Permianibacter fluminis TaxID=2738515 RepID=UPI001551D80E|nr:DUF4124 domain-containing protein [Permianibacter fluminis]NQD36210.1 DUF4124 domain-containing protein [Permianibacter fluminis]